MTDAIQIRRMDQLGASPAEPLAMALVLDLMERGMIRTQIHAWNDRATYAVTPESEVVGVIAWRTMDWTRDAFVCIGGVKAPYRRRGLYRRLFQDLCADIALNHPKVDRITSGHHIDNAASEAMHRALGRTLEGLSYTFPVVRP